MSPDGSPDKNVFDIQQGVAIIVAVKRRTTGAKTKPLAPVLHAELWGTRNSKNQALWEHFPASLEPQDVSPHAAPWRFKPTDKETETSYLNGFSVADLFGQNGSPAPGIVTTQDEFAISWTASEAVNKVESLLATKHEAEARRLFRLCSQSQWNYEAAKKGLSDGEWRKKVIPIHYRPLDDRFTVFDSHVAVHRRERATSHLVGHDNLALAIPRQTRDEVGGWVIRYPSTHKIFAAYDINFILPLYLYAKEGRLESGHRLNLDPKLYAAISKAGGIDPPDQAGPDDDFRAATGEARPSEVKVFDYIYGVLHSPAYRETFSEFLKIDFPRIPYPPSPEVFADVSEKGEQLRRLHLMEPAAIGETPYPYFGDGDDVVASGYPKWEEEKSSPSTGSGRTGRVLVSKDQYFADVPEVAWNFHIGGYQPAQKWLKDRRGRTLSFDDITHYQRIVKILVETDRIMKEIELPLIKPARAPSAHPHHCASVQHESRCHDRAPAGTPPASAG